MAYNPSTNTLTVSSAPSVSVFSYTRPALTTVILNTPTSANVFYIGNISVQTAESVKISTLVNAPALAGIQMTQISGPVPNYTITNIISQVQTWGS